MNTSGRTRTRRRTYRYFIVWGGVLFISMVGLSMTLFSFVFAPAESFFFNLAAALVVSWTLILTLYYVWAIYFYNINRGMTGKEFGKSRTPDRNPNAEATLGLPPGTVRGTLALSVLVIAMAMMIASLSMPAAMKENEVMVDHFEILKSGFVMVIAFYFGTKSLEILRDRKRPAASGKHVQSEPESVIETEGEHDHALHEDQNLKTN